MAVIQNRQPGEDILSHTLRTLFRIIWRAIWVSACVAIPLVVIALIGLWVTRDPPNNDVVRWESRASHAAHRTIEYTAPAHAQSMPHWLWVEEDNRLRYYCENERAVAQTEGRGIELDCLTNAELEEYHKVVVEQERIEAEQAEQQRRAALIRTGAMNEQGEELENGHQHRQHTRSDAFMSAPIHMLANRTHDGWVEYERNLVDQNSFGVTF